jgi:P-type conjugative transfer protein TrbL
MTFQYGFLNTALQNFIDAITNVWAPIFQSTGVQILLGIGAIALAVYAIQLLISGDVYQFIMGFATTILSLAVLYAVFLTAQELAGGIYGGFLVWGQQVTGFSPSSLTPSGVMETGLQLARQFYAAAGLATWFRAPVSTLVTVFCAIVMVVAFGLAAIIYLLALIQVWTFIIGASVLLAFAALSWTWHIFPGWGISTLSVCVKIFFLLAILGLGLVEAEAWTAAMAGTSASIVEDASLALEAMVESLLFLALVYYIPGLMAGLILGAASSVMNAGEALIAGIASAGASAVGGVAAAAARPGAVAATAGKTIEAARATVNKMLLR